MGGSGRFFNVYIFPSGWVGISCGHFDAEKNEQSLNLLLLLLFCKMKHERRLNVSLIDRYEMVHWVGRGMFVDIAFFVRVV